MRQLKLTGWGISVQPAPSHAGDGEMWDKVFWSDEIETQIYVLLATHFVVVKLKLHITKEMSTK